MVQKTFHIAPGKSIGLSDVVAEISARPEYESSSQILLTVFMECWDADTIEGQMAFLKNKLPKVEIAGITHRDGFVSDEMDEPHLILSFFFFENPAFEVLRFDMNGMSDADAGKTIHEKLTQIQDIKGALTFFAELNRNMDLLMQKMSEGMPDIPMVGAPGNASNDMGHGVFFLGVDAGRIVNFVFDDDACYQDTALIVAFYGERLHIQTSYVFGWTPVGRTMTVTKATPPFIINEIDGKPAAEMYRKYLGLTRQRITAINVCEFPLIVERDGLPVARIPVDSFDDGSILFGVSVNEGEKARLTYGAQFRIFGEVYEDSLSYDDFNPDGMLLIVCGNRLLFLRDDEEKEINYYRKLSGELAVLHGNSEIYRYQGRGGELNSALLAFAIREGDADGPAVGISRENCPFEATRPDDEIMPLGYRTMNFMSAVTDDLMEMTKAAEAANRAKGAFLSNMTHEIRSPINAVLGMDEMILRESRDDTILDYAENIKSAGNTLLGLVNDVLDMSRIEAGRIEIIPVEYHMASLVNDLVTMISQRAKDKGLKLLLDIDENLPSKLYGDEIRFKQVVTNILTNAVKYTEKGSVKMSMTAVERTGDSVAIEVRVKDTGIGIKEEDMPKLFRAFERIEEERNRNVEGTGLGMNITIALLDMMGSRLEVESVYGKGSDFHFVLSQQVMDEAPIGDYEKALRDVRAKREKYHESFIAPTARILVVDDTPMNLMVLKSLLKQTLVQIHTADSGDACLGLIQEERYDLIFLDDRMPGKSGVETLHEMQAMEHLNKDVPVVILTANSADDAKKEYLKEGFTDYLAKPIDPQVLEDMLRDYLPDDKLSEPDEAAEAAVQNTAAGEAVYSGELYEETLRMYVEEIPDYAVRLDEMYIKGDWENYTINIHALKSSSRLIGENELASLAEKLEHAGDSLDIDFIREHHDEFMDWYRSLSDKYAPEAITDSANGPEIDGNQLQDAFHTIKELSGMYDYESIEDIFKQLSEYSIPDDMKKEYDRLYQAFRRVDWDELGR